MITVTAYTLLALSLALVVYAYAVYPALLKLLAPRFRERDEGITPPAPQWPEITITVPAYNEETAIRGMLDRILELDYPRDKLQVLIISDASTDKTDEIVRQYADRGVELLRLSRRSGKTAAENATRQYIRGAIVVNTDASVRIDPHGLKPLVAQFSDPSVGVASGRDVSVARTDGDANAAESDYVTYEMWVRDLESRVDSIVGASGCFFATRRELHSVIVPNALSRDFAAPLIAREHGFRAVSVNDAVCYVPRTPSLRKEYRRKIRTMTRGLETLYYKRHLLNPLRYGLFAWMLASHKLARWLVPWALLIATAALMALAPTAAWARLALAGAAFTALLALVAWYWPEERSVPRMLAVPGYLIFGLLAGLIAWINAARGDLNPIWEPTRRGPFEQQERHAEVKH